MKLRLSSFSEGLSQSLIMVGGNIASTGFSALALILLSRLITPDAFGEFSVGLAIVLILARINDIGLSSAIQKYVGETSTPSKQNEYFSVLIQYKLLISFLIVILGFLLYYPIQRLLNLEHPQIILISFTIGLSTAYFESVTAILLSLRLVMRATVLNSIQAASKVIFIVFFYALNIRSVLPIFISFVLAPLLPVFFVKLFLPKEINISITKKYVQARRKLFSMAKHTGLSQITSAFSDQISLLLVQAYLSSYETGILGGVMRIEMIFSLIFLSIGNVLYPRAARYKSHSLRKIYFKKVLLYILLLFILIFPLLFGAEWLVVIVLGENYLPGVNVLRYLLSSTFVFGATIPLIAFFYSHSSSRFFSIFGIANLILTLVGNFLLLPTYGIIGIGITSLVTRLFLFVSTLVWSINVYKKEKYLG